mgnify:FL=1
MKSNSEKCNWKSAYSSEYLREKEEIENYYKLNNKLEVKVYKIQRKRLSQLLDSDFI